LPPNENYRIVENELNKGIEDGEEAQRNHEAYTAWASSTNVKLQRLNSGEIGKITITDNIRQQEATKKKKEIKKY